VLLAYFGSKPPAGSIEPDTLAVLDPSTYGSLSVKSRGRANLRSGVYSFNSLAVEPNAVLGIDTTANPTPISS
jgi:hypothetical protein